MKCSERHGFDNVMKASILTLGCRVNQYESDAISEMLQNVGFEMVSFGEDCDITIVNTCTVTAESDRKSRQLARRAKTACPHTKVIVTGCFAQVSPEEAGKCGADCVIGNGDKEKVCEAALAMAQGNAFSDSVGNIFTAPYDSLKITKPKRARTFIKIEDGCENKCAYCIIPRARGHVRSKQPEKVLEEVKHIASTGCTEVILTGIETASYGRDLNCFGLDELLSRVNDVEGIERIALGSLDPSALTPSFVSKVSGLNCVLPHFHLSVQAGCTKTLNRMRRKYTAERVLENMANMRLAMPQVTFSADVIVGFPGESEADFEETVEFCRTAEFLHLHIFPYSVRRGTEAESMEDQIPEAEKKRRAARLAEVQKDIQDKMLDGYVKKHSDESEPVYVLCEKWERGISNGHTEHFVECDISTESDMTGKILKVVTEGRSGKVLVGKNIEK